VGELPAAFGTSATAASFSASVRCRTTCAARRALLGPPHNTDRQLCLMQPRRTRPPLLT
jgi:hypothetical protein